MKQKRLVLKQEYKVYYSCILKSVKASTDEVSKTSFLMQKRAKLNVPTPVVPMEVRAEKALEAIYVCCFGRDPMEEEDERLLRIILNAVFPSVGQPEVDRIVKEKARKVAEGGEDDRSPEPQPLSKEAVQLQMKDLEFLKQNNRN